MAVWLPAQNKFYLPPQPSTRVLSTDEYVTRTSIFYHASTDRLLTVGHPYFDIYHENKKDIIVPKVSPNAYRVFRLKLPDPNNFAFGDKSIFDPEKERLVWALRGVEIDRGQPLGCGITGHPIFNKFADVENAKNVGTGHDAMNAIGSNTAFDPKQTQMFLIGCKPALGEHWSRAAWCKNNEGGGLGHKDTDCPPIELKTTSIEDGDMVDIGFGAMDFNDLQQDKTSVPLDIYKSKCKYPDYIKMANDPYGDFCFFYVRREQMYARHYFTRYGKISEKEQGDTLEDDNPPLSTNNYFTSPSGSLVSSEGQLFNRPYWIQRSQGQNNGIAWNNQLFLTVVDNTRGTALNIIVGQNGTPNQGAFKANEYYTYLRHVEEFDISVILQLCKVRLTPENLAIIHTMDPNIIEAWHLNVNPPSGILDETYRYIHSMATKCPSNVPPSEKEDPYSKLKFWEVDLRDRLTEQLDQTPLGRKFLFQTNVIRGGVKRPRVVTTSSKAKPVKRRRGNK
ncbi:L1 protein [Crocuta crocuta papillomavirus 1]|uniref:Major capsid protein L1 n=1 Tax=Crocuta crocuta papillomavirus 1 TaxID=1104917 RepID=J7EZS5_9PAPI|nr:L1 protein [Crocuta crocuta papillomavirus 1]AER38253.1 L1 protein [Crocuta crocuta papillomavirus 1]